MTSQRKEIYLNPELSELKGLETKLCADSMVLVDVNEELIDWN